MLFSTVFFWQIALAVHVLFVVLAFGLLLVYPFMVLATERIEPRFLPGLMRMRQFLGRTLVNPGLVVVVAAGVYLAADLHQWQDFYVQWGIGAVIVIAGLEGSFVIRRSGKLAELAQRDIAAAGEGEITWSREYLTARGRSDQVNALLAMIVVVTIFLMVVR